MPLIILPRHHATVVNYSVIFILLLAGCQSPSDLKGKWTGKAGIFKASLKFDDKGRGKFCYIGKYQGVEKFGVEWSRYHAGVIHTKSGTDLVIQSISGKELIIEVDSDGVVEYIFTRDDKLKRSTWYCRKMLK